MKFRMMMLITLLVILVGCTQAKDEYKPNPNPPLNVREAFYKKSIEVINFYMDKTITKSEYTDRDNEFLLGYYRSTPSSSSEELEIKTSITYLDLIYKEFEYNRSKDKEEEMDMSIEEFSAKLTEVLKLLEIVQE